MTGPLWTLPIVGAVVGWGTNMLAVRMLFRPRKPFGLPGLKLHGVVPRRRKELAARIAATVERELISSSDVREMVTDPELIACAEAEIDRRVREFLARKMDDLPTVALLLLPADLEDRIRTSIVAHVMESLPEIAERVGDKLGETLDVRSLVEERVNSFPDGRLEEIVLQIARRELRTIEVLGGVIGALIGGVQWLVLALLV